MLLTLLLTIGAMGIFVVFMSIGLILQGKELKGTCASKSVALFGEDAVCSVCGQIPGSCDTNDKKETIKA